MAEGRRTHEGAGLGSEKSYGSGVDRGGRKRDKKKTVSEEGVSEITAETERLPAEGQLFPSPRQHQPSRAVRRTGRACCFPGTQGRGREGRREGDGKVLPED